jgi:hypothetical protein
MNKLKDLLEKSGCNPELIPGIMNLLEEYKTQTDSTLKEESSRKIEQAKKVCLEETANYKRELARRTAIWCEAKSAAIDAILAKQSAHKETPAIAKLKNIRSMLEGIEVHSQNGNTKAADQKVKQLEEALKQANAKTVRAESLCQRALASNRKLVADNRRLQTAGTAPAAVSEGRGPKTPTTRIDEGRGRGTSVTHRPTTRTNQQPHPQDANRGVLTEGRGPQDAYSIDGIAEAIQDL